SEIDELARTLPAFAWLGYSIHGDEISGVDAAAQLIYQLAAGTDQATLDLLDNVVIIIDPTQNPDGRERYLSMIESYQSKVPNYNRFAMQHQGVWPYGRGNHYLFDLNRDWILVRQPETKGRLATMKKWHPQLVVDAHEMGSNATYLFSPPRQPINDYTSDHFLKWIETFAADQANAFDQRGWPYYVKEWHEQWYPGYGSAWPVFSGVIGILYEMAGVDGQFVKQQDDYLLTYHEAVNKHFTSSLANIRTLATNRTQILREYYDARKKIIDEGKQSNLAFLFKPDRDELKMKRFVESLTAQGIEVQCATSSFRVASATDAYGTKKSSVTFPVGTYIVQTDQTQGALAKAVLEFDPRLHYEFLKEERRELEKYGDTRMYEVSTWSVPLAYNLDAYWTTALIKATSELVVEMNLSSCQLYDPDAQFGFVVDMVGEKTDQMLVKLYDHELVTYCSEKPFTLEGRDYEAGALVLRRRGNPENMIETLSQLATEIGINVYGVSTGSSEQGSFLGAGTFQLLQKPRVALIAGEGISGTSFGAVWYTIDQELGLPHSLVSLPQLDWNDLDAYNVLIVPGSWGRMDISRGGQSKIRDWVEDGGTLICMGRSAVWAADTARSISQVRLKRQTLDKLEEYNHGVALERQAESPDVDTIALWYPEKATNNDNDKDKDKPSMPGKEDTKRIDEWQRKFSPQGVIMKAELDTEEWLNFGLGGSVPVMMYTSNAFLAKSPVNTVARFADRNGLRISGLLWPEARERWANTAYLTQERKGKGQVILFAGHPNQRGYFYGSRQMLVNAILLAPGFGARFDGPYEENY
ncbi:MAG: hypothetical protein J7J98_03030, partial [candidate division Zixibacteria bacterium]|nr:hypothetical protein [candidate division Zixibacteria bacterium]